jgi:hypothetical protein
MTAKKREKATPGDYLPGWEGPDPTGDGEPKEHRVSSTPPPYPHAAEVAKWKAPTGSGLKGSGESRRSLRVDLAVPGHEHDEPTIDYAPEPDSRSEIARTRRPAISVSVAVRLADGSRTRVTSAPPTLEQYRALETKEAERSKPEQEKSSRVAPDQDFGTSQRIGEGDRQREPLRFGPTSSWIDPSEPETVRAARRGEVDADDARFDEDMIPRCESSSAVEDDWMFEVDEAHLDDRTVWERNQGLAPEWFEDEEHARRRQERERERQRAEEAVLVAQWRSELRCSHCGELAGKQPLRKGLCDPCRKFQRRTGQLPDEIGLARRRLRRDAPVIT